MPVNRGLQPNQVADSQRQRLSEFISRPMGAGKRVSSLTVRSGDRSIESGSKLAQTLRQSLARASSAYRADFTISGNRVGTDNLTGAPIANESGSATLHRGLAKGSNVTPIRVPATKADLPGVPAIITRGSPLLGNRQVLMDFLDSRGFGGDADTGSSIDTNSIQVDDDCDPNAGSVNFRVNDPPPDPPLPPEDWSGSPLEPDDPPPEPVNFDCVNGRCVRSPTGFYDTLSECQAFCQQRYSCVDGDCIPDANGFYNNSTECLNGCRARYECVSGECVRFPTGQFASLQSCVQLCSQPLNRMVYDVYTLGTISTSEICESSFPNFTLTITEPGLPFLPARTVTSWRPPFLRFKDTSPPALPDCCNENYRTYALIVTLEDGTEVEDWEVSAGNCSWRNESIGLIPRPDLLI